MIDNYGRETVADTLIQDGLTILEARDLCEELNAQRRGGEVNWVALSRPSAFEKNWKSRKT